MNRRDCLAMFAALIATKATALDKNELPELVQTLDPLQQAWSAWKSLCLTPEGRVVDSFQDSASHSEGQGYGLTLAALFGDLASCQAIVTWTEQNLAVRNDALLAWRWQHESVPQVSDLNNASDGDLFYAWGLFIASEIEGNKGFADRATAIAQDLDRHCLVDHPAESDQVVFLPAAAGFVRDDGIIINPSYYMPLAMTQVAEMADVPRLAQAGRDGLTMVDELGRLGPVPDWVFLTASGNLPAPPEYSAISGYEAVRVPLFALWSGNSQSPAVQSYIRATSDLDDVGTPTKIDPQTGAITERSTHSGYAAVAELASCAAAHRVGSLMPRFDTNQPYYPATLHLMSLIVQRSIYPRCVPL